MTQPVRVSSVQDIPTGNLVRATGDVYLDAYSVSAVYFSAAAHATVVMFMGGETVEVAAEDVVAEVVTNLNAVTGKSS